MKKPTVISLILFLLLSSCNERNKTSAVREPADSLKVDSTKIEKTVDRDNDEPEKKAVNLPENALFVDILKNFYESESYYVELYYSKGYTEETPSLIAKNHGETIYEGQEMTRTKVPLDIAQRYLEVEFIDSMYVLNEDQEVIDSIFLQNIEYLDAMIESNYIASYSHSKDLAGKLIISKSDHLKNLKNSPSFKESKESLIKELQLTIDSQTVGKTFQLNHGTDAFHILSYTDKEYNHQILLLKNGSITDTIDGYYIKEIQPVPLASDNKTFYIIHGAVPDTDMLWTQLIGIDLTTGEFIELRGNRLKYK